MIGAFFASLLGRCPSCRKGGMKESLLSLRERCPACGAVYERVGGAGVIATSLAVFSGATVGYVLLHLPGRESNVVPASTFIPAVVIVVAITYPVFKNVAVFLLYAAGFVYPDPDPPAAGRPGATLAATTGALPPEDDPTCADGGALAADDPTDHGDDASA